MKTSRNVFPKPACYRGKIDDGLAKLRVTEKGDGRLAGYHSTPFRCIQGQQESKVKFGVCYSNQFTFHHCT